MPYALRQFFPTFWCARDADHMSPLHVVSILPNMSKTKKYIPDLRIRRPYKRESKRIQIPPYTPIDTFNSMDDEYPCIDGEDNETPSNRRYRSSSD